MYHHKQPYHRFQSDSLHSWRLQQLGPRSPLIGGLGDDEAESTFTTPPTPEEILQASSSHYFSLAPLYLHFTPTNLIFKMRSQLCYACRQIPGSFFSEEHDYTWFKHGPKVSLQPFNSMRRAASSGCPLCAILTARVVHRRQADFLPLDVMEQDPVILRRAVIDSHQGIGLWIGMDDISHSTFFRVPTLWSKHKALLA